MVLRKSFPSKSQFVVILVTICILLVFCSEIYINYSQSARNIITMLIKYHLKNLPKINSNRDNMQEKCIIPLTPIWPDHFPHWDPQSYVYNCSYERKLTELKDDKIKKLQPATNISCCLHDVILGGKNATYHLTKCTPLINDTEDVTDREVMLVKCGNSTDFHVNIPMKPKVQEKLSYWEGISDVERPFSVFILGIDTVSRSHAYRSLPKTMKLMKELDFIDFQAYHTIAPSTLTNLMPILMGLPRAKVRETCAKNWKTPFDKCPLIWKNFRAQNYVTGYVEDGGQSFDWSRKSGFVNETTDYYFPHLFYALIDSIRYNTRKSGRNIPKYYSECTPYERAPEFLLRYSIRWLEKFSNIPHFFFSWFAYPFHDDMYSLAGFDEHLTSFYKFLKSRETLLRKSVVIFVSDHGDKASPLYPKSIESYFERSLPIFQIRLPDEMKEKYPDIVEAIQSNSRKLITPFDIHHTLLHVLSLNSNVDLNSRRFKPEEKDRCSLFVRVPSNRTCASTNILKDCLCNTQYDNNTHGNGSTNEISSGLAEKLLGLSVSYLNTEIINSNYSKFCLPWNSSFDDIIYTRYISQTKSYSEILIAFTANHKAKFEARFKIKKSPAVLDKLTEVVGVSRIDLFGGQSWCMPTLTDEDKEMRAFCLCKDRKG